MPARASVCVGGQRLRPGHHGLQRAQVMGIQRSRMIAATVEAVGELGYARMTVADVIGRARVSRKTFYDVFADREDCFLLAFEEQLGRASLIAREAYEHEGSWRAGIRSALARLLVLMDQEPAVARLCVIDTLAGGPRVLARRGELLEELATAIDWGRSCSERGREPSPLTAEAIVGGVLSVLHTRLSRSEGEPLTELLAPLMSMLVLPYLGARAASRELSKPAPRPQVTHVERPGHDPDVLEGLNMRLTYRTVRVLTAIAGQPGASNREIAAEAGILDQGQISKLLTRLTRLGLIDNYGEGQPSGAANAWQLTPRGVRLERASRPSYHP